MDPGDIWIHESFTTYSEALYVEYWNNIEQSKKYLGEQYPYIKNTEPLVGPYDVYYHARKNNDIYYKGTWILHTLRGMVDNDTLWFHTLLDLNTRFFKKTTTTREVTAYLAQRLGVNLDAFFNQYLYTASLPVFEYKIEKKYDGRMVMRYHWKNAVKGFDLPVKVTVTKGKFETITPGKKWQLIDLNYFEEKDFKILENSYLMEVKRLDIQSN
jgi:aminopeptidase N